MIPIFALMAVAALYGLVDLMPRGEFRTFLQAWLFVIGFVCLLGLTEKLTDWDRAHPVTTWADQL